MPSPFPGMDPYQEQSGRWPDFHSSVSTYTRDALNERRPRRCLASVNEQFRLAEVPGIGDELIRPDVAVTTIEPGGGPLAPGVAVATLEPVTRTLPIPLRDRDPDVSLDLATVVAMA